MTHWTLWLTVIGVSGLAALATWSSDDLGAGADWFSYGKTWIRTYELTQIELGKSWGVDDLELKDVEGHEVSISVLKIQKNTELWNLVYHGMLHSVHYGGATTNQRAQERLHLDRDARLLSGEDPA